MTTPKTAFFEFCISFSVLNIFVSFAEAGREQLAEKEKKRDIEYTTAPSTRAPPHQASRVAEVIHFTKVKFTSF